MSVCVCQSCASPPKARDAGSLGLCNLSQVGSRNSGFVVRPLYLGVSRSLTHSLGLAPLAALQPMAGL